MYVSTKYDFNQYILNMYILDVRVVIKSVLTLANIFD